MVFSRTHVLLDILLSSIQGSLSDLETHLGGGIINKAAECRVHEAAGSHISLLLLLLTISIALLLGHWGWR